MCDQDERQRQGTMFSEQNFFRYKISRMRFCSGCGTNKQEPSLRQTGLSLFNSTAKSPFCPVCPWDGWGLVPGTIVPQGPAEKCLCVRWIQEGFKGGVFCRSTSTAFGALFWAIRFGFWGFARLYLRLLVRNSDFRPVILTFGPESESFENSPPNHFSGVLQ